MRSCYLYVASSVPTGSNIHWSQVFGAESVFFQNLPEIINRFLTAPEPIVLQYTLNPTVPPPERPLAWDAEIKMEDTTLKNKMAVVVNPSKESVESLTKLDEEVCFFGHHSMRLILI